jgi:hypothetical protein
LNLVEGFFKNIEVKNNRELKIPFFSRKAVSNHSYPLSKFNEQGGAMMLKTILKFVLWVLIILAVMVFLVWVFPGPWIRNTVPAAPSSQVPVVVTVLVPERLSVPETQVCPAAIASLTPAPTATLASPADFGPELHFPGKATGPAIAELWNPNTGFCALVKINLGETLDWSFKGSWWQAPSQDVLDARWPHHVAEYVAKSDYGKCHIYISAAEVPAQ